MQQQQQLCQQARDLLLGNLRLQASLAGIQRLLSKVMCLAAQLRVRSPHKGAVEAEVRRICQQLGLLNDLERLTSAPLLARVP